MTDAPLAPPLDAADEARHADALRYEALWRRLGELSVTEQGTVDTWRVAALAGILAVRHRAPTIRSRRALDHALLAQLPSAAAFVGDDVPVLTGPFPAPDDALPAVDLPAFDRAVADVLGNLQAVDAGSEALSGYLVWQIAVMATTLNQDGADGRSILGVFLESAGTALTKAG